MRYLHLSDNENLAQNDKYAKVRPLFDLPNVRFSQYFPNEQNLSIDESMIPLLREKFAKTNKRNATSIWLQTVGHYHAFGICLSFGTLPGGRDWFLHTTWSWLWCCRWASG